MTRHEFTIAVKRAALERSAGRCEAIGPRYGYRPGERCERPVAPGAVNYEHYPRGAHDPDPETTTLKNCTAICPACNQFAANHTDKAAEAKIKRVRRAHGLDPDNRKHKPKKIANRPFPKGQKTNWGIRPFPKRNP